MCNQQSLRSACPYSQSDQSLCLSLEYSMSVKLLAEHHLGYLSLKGGYTGSSEFTLIKMPHCWISHVAAHTVKPVLNGHSKEDLNLVFKTDYRLMQVKSIHWEHSAIISTCFKLPPVLKTYVLSISWVAT